MKGVGYLRKSLQKSLTFLQFFSFSVFFWQRYRLTNINKQGQLKHLKKCTKKVHLGAILRLGMRSFSFLRNGLRCTQIAMILFWTFLLTQLCTNDSTDPWSLSFVLFHSPLSSVSKRETSPIHEIFRFILVNKLVNNPSVMISDSGYQSNSRGIPVNLVRNPAHDCVQEINCQLCIKQTRVSWTLSLRWSVRTE